MENISQSQLAALIIMFQIGSSPLFLLGGEAGADAWIAVLIAMVAGLLLLLFLTLPIHRIEPDKDMIEIFRLYLGRFAGYALGVVYLLYFSYKSIRNIREFGDLMIMYLLPRTPLSVLLVVVLLIAGYAVSQGIEVFGRITQIIMPWIISTYATFFVIIYATGLFDVKRIQPVLEHGIKKTAAVALPELVSFPFGEMVLFLMFWKFAAPKQGTTKVTAWVYVGTGLFITLTTIVITGSLGDIAGMVVIPFIEIMSDVQFADFIERLDPLVAALLFTGVFIKMTAYYFGATIVGTHLVKAKRGYIVLGVGVLLFAGSLLFRSYMQQVWVGFDLNIKYHFPIFQIYIPFALLLVMLVRSRLGRSPLGGR